MTVAFDAVDTGTATSGDEITVANVTSAGTLRLLVVIVGNTGSGGPGVNTITKGATSITAEAWEVTNAPYWNSTLRYLVNPTTTSETVTVELDADLDSAVVGVMSFNTVDQTTPVGTATTAQADGNDPTGLTITSATGDMVVGSLVSGWTTTRTFQGDGTERYSLAAGGFTGASGSTAPGAASVNVEWGEGAGYANAHILGGVNINDGAAGGATNPKGPFGMPFHGPFGGPI